MMINRKKIKTEIKIPTVRRWKRNKIKIKLQDYKIENKEKMVINKVKNDFINYDI